MSIQFAQSFHGLGLALARPATLRPRVFPLLFVLLLMMLTAVAHAQAGCINITSYGGNGNGSVDNTTAFNTTVGHLASTGGCIAFPAGKYLFNSAVTVSYNTGAYSLTLVGAGADNTTLYFPASSGISLNLQSGQQALQSLHVRDMTFTTGSAGGGYSALTLSDSGGSAYFGQSDISRVVFRGDDGGVLTDYWTAGVYVSGLSNITFESDLFYGDKSGNDGTGVALTGVSAYPGGALNIAKSSFYSEGIGLAIESYIAGVTVTQSNFVNGATCLWVPGGNSGVGTVSLVSGNNFNCTGTQILLQSSLASLVMNGNQVYLGAAGKNNIGVWFDAPGPDESKSKALQGYSLVNNVFSGLAVACQCSAAGEGIVVNFQGTGSVQYGMAMGNVFFDLLVGVDLTSASKWNVQGNFYDPSTTTPVINPTQNNSVGKATD